MGFKLKTVTLRLMDFEFVLKNLLENAIESFNTGDYNALDELFTDNVHFTAPAYNNQFISAPAVEFFDKYDVFQYWKDLNSKYSFKITDFIFLSIGKVSTFRNRMDGIGYVIDCEIYFNEYGKVTKLYNHIVAPQTSTN